MYKSDRLNQAIAYWQPLKFATSVVVRRIRIVPLVVAVGLSLVGCSWPKLGPATTVPIAAPGEILVDVLEGGQPEHYWQFEIRPEAGSVRSVRDAIFQDYKHEEIPTSFQQPAGALKTCAGSPHAASPDRRLDAYCTNDGTEKLNVVDAASGKVLQHWNARKRGIRGFAWAPNSRWVGILNVKSRVGYSPRELLAFISGHPVQHDDIFLTFLEVDTGKVAEYVIHRNVISSFTRVLSWAP